MEVKKLMQKKLLILVATLIAALIICGASTAATVKTNHINAAKITHTGTSIIWQTNPAIDGYKVVWTQLTPKNSNIYCKNLKTGKVFKVQPSPQIQYSPDISGNIVVWTQVNTLKNGIDKYSVYFKNLSSGICGRVVPTRQDQLFPKISGTKIIWIQNRDDVSSLGTLYMKDLITKKITKISSSAADIDISSNRVIWTEGSEEVVIKIKNLKTNSIETIGSAPYSLGYSSPVISGHIAVWTLKGIDYYYTLYYKNLITNKTAKVLNAPHIYMEFPAISGTRIVWMQSPTVMKSNIMIKNLATNTSGKLLPSQKRQLNPSISGTKIVWEQVDSTKQRYIYLLNFSTHKYGRLTT